MSIHLGVLPGHWNSAPQVDPQAPALKQGSGFMSHSHFNICAKDVDIEYSLPRTTIALGLFYIATSWTYGLINNNIIVHQGAKKIIFTACHLGKLKLAFTSPDVISTSPKNFLTSRIDGTVLLLFEFLKKHYFPVGQVKNRIH